MGKEISNIINGFAIHGISCTTHEGRDTVSEGRKIENVAVEEISAVKGISGWLSPEGEFIQAEYGRHNEVAAEMSRNVNGERVFEVLGYIRFTCRQTGSNTYESFVFFPQQFGCKEEITYSQLAWLEDNMDKMAARQKSYVMQYMYYVYGREHTLLMDLGYGF
jgi:hypothetical protein